MKEVLDKLGITERFNTAENEITDKLGLAKRLGVAHGWLYTLNGDNPGFTEDADEMSEMKKLKGYTVLGEIGKTSVAAMAERLAEVRENKETAELEAELVSKMKRLGMSDEQIDGMLSDAKKQMNELAKKVAADF